MRFGRKKEAEGQDATSLISLPWNGRRRSSLCEICPAVSRSDRISVTDLNRDGLITPPVATRHGTIGAYALRNAHPSLGFVDIFNFSILIRLTFKIKCFISSSFAKKLLKVCFFDNLNEWLFLLKWLWFEKPF